MGVTPVKNRAQTIADLYDVYLPEITRRDGFHFGYSLASERFLDKVVPHLTERSREDGPRAADLCCGIGASSRILARRLGAEVVGVDIVPALTQAATERAQQAQGQGRVSFTVGDVMRLPLRAGSLDLVWSEDAFCHVPDKQRLFQECHRTLKDDGVLAFTDWVPGPASQGREQAIEEFERAWRLAPMPPAERYYDIVRDAGFTIVHTDAVALLNMELNDQYEEAAGISSWTVKYLALAMKKESLISQFGLTHYEEEMARMNFDSYFRDGTLDIIQVVALKADGHAAD